MCLCLKNDDNDDDDDGGDGRFLVIIEKNQLDADWSMQLILALVDFSVSVLLGD